MLDTNGALLMIDRAGSRDRDDAFAVYPDPLTGGWTVEVHIAAVADVVPAGSAADKAAYTRGESKYLPGRTIPMLGTSVEEAATLTSQAERASMRICMSLAADGTLINTTIARGRITAGRCQAIDHQAAAAATTDPGNRLHTQMAAAERLATVLYSRRLDRGALAFYDLAHGWAAGEDGAIMAIPQAARTSAYIVVQEIMILANTAVANWAAAQGLPILFRNHETNPVTGSGSRVAEELLAAAADSAHFERVRTRVQATLRRAAYSATVHGHFALSLAAYTHATSPLRRIADVINQRVVLAAVDGAEPPYDSHQLARMADEINRRIDAVKDAKSEVFKQRDRRKTSAAAAADLSALDSDRWTKVLVAVVEQAPPTAPAEIAAELLRRASAGELLPLDLATLLNTGEGWRSLVGEVFDKAAAAHPEYGPSVLSIAMQDQRGADQCEVSEDGPPHARVFAARISTPAGRGAWALASTKKQATQAAAWNVLAVLAGLTADSNEELRPIFPNRSTMDASTPLPPRGADSPGTGEARTRQQPSPAQTATARARAYGKAQNNPVAWLNSQLPQPQWQDSRSGPDHAPTFECVVTFDGQRCSGTAKTKTAAKVAAAAAMVELLFEDRITS